MNPEAEPAVPQPLVSAPAPTNNIFREPNGIRAGWRALIFLAIVAGLVGAVNLVILLVAQFVLHHWPHIGMTSSLSPAVAALSDGSLFLFGALAALIMARIEHRKWGENTDCR